MRIPRVALTRKRRTVAAAALAFVAMTGLGLASAAQLAVNPGSLGAGSGVVASCQPVGQPVSVGFTSTYAAGQYSATAVRLSNVAATCAGLRYRLQLVATDGTRLGSEVTGTVALTGGVLTVPLPSSTPSMSIGSVSVVVHS